jgi:retron-type reverse transcriptase
MRQLGIPTVIDRIVQQAIAQVLNNSPYAKMEKYKKML